MAYKTATIIRKVLESSGRTEAEVCEALGKDGSYLEDVTSGRAHLSPTGLAGIAQACGYRLVVTNGSDSLEVASAILPTGQRQFEGTGKTHECEYTGKAIAFTGDFFGLSEGAQKALCEEIGATWNKKVGKKATDVLVKGDLSRYNGTSRQLDDANKWGKEVVEADAFRAVVESAIGRPIA